MLGSCNAKRRTSPEGTPRIFHKSTILAPPAPSRASYFNLSTGPNISAMWLKPLQGPKQMLQ